LGGGCNTNGEEEERILSVGREDGRTKHNGRIILKWILKKWD
jgi:hypothetical protein